MEECAQQSHPTLSADFRILCHHLYEYKKGLRLLVMQTMPAPEQHRVESFLSTRGIDYCILPISESKFNILFGDESCVNIVKGFHSSALNELTAEEDFMLGIMLGYDRQAQCERFLRRRECMKVRL